MNFPMRDSISSSAKKYLLAITLNNLNFAHKNAEYDIEKYNNEYTKTIFTHAQRI
jgi:hypothetical protein